PRGSVFGLLGPNGAGKSTFINILARLCRKTSGQVSIWGRDIDQRPRDARAAIGVVPQEIAADPFFTPREALEVSAGMYAVPAAPALPGFETRPTRSGGFSVSYRTGHSSVEQVLAAIRAAGLHIKDISTEDPDLEDVFVALTSAKPEADSLLTSADVIV